MDQSTPQPKHPPPTPCFVVKASYAAITNPVPKTRQTTIKNKLVGIVARLGGGKHDHE